MTEDEDVQLLLDSARRMVAKAITEHHAAGRSTIHWENGIFFWLHPDGSREDIGPELRHDARTDRPSE